MNAVKAEGNLLNAVKAEGDLFNAVKAEDDDDDGEDRMRLQAQP